MRENKTAVFGSGALIGTLGGGGLIGLGGAEFRLPILIGLAWLGGIGGCHPQQGHEPHCGGLGVTVPRQHCATGGRGQLLARNCQPTWR